MLAFELLDLFRNFECTRTVQKVSEQNFFKVNVQTYWLVGFIPFIGIFLGLNVRTLAFLLMMKVLLAGTLCNRSHLPHGIDWNNFNFMEPVNLSLFS